MPRRCSICDHPDRETISWELCAGGDIPTLAAFHGVSTDALHRHRRNHLLPAQRDRLASDPELGDVDVLSEMRNLYRRMGEFLAKAEAADDWPAVKAFHSEARKDLELLVKLTEVIKDGSRTAVNVGGIDQQRVQSAILRALEGFPEARVAVADALGEIEGV